MMRDHMKRLLCVRILFDFMINYQEINAAACGDWTPLSFLLLGITSFLFLTSSLTHSPCQALHPGLEGAVADDDPREASPDVPRRTCGTKEKERDRGRLHITSADRILH